MSKSLKGKTKKKGISTEPATDEYYVEKILDVTTTRNGGKEYFLKWKGYGDEFNSWIAEEDIAEDLIEAFEESERIKYKLDTKSSKSVDKSSDDYVLEAEKVIGVCKTSDGLLFLIKWAGVDKADFISCSVASLKYPQILIKFFEEKISWRTKAPLTTGDNEHAVEKVLEERINSHGVKEYFVKWEDHENEDNCWVVENYVDKNHIKAFEERKKQELKDYLEGLKGKSGDKILHGFDRGLEPEEIIGATNTSGPLLFLMKWADVNESDLVSAEVANVICPQIVIKFYLQKLTLYSTSSEEDN